LNGADLAQSIKLQLQDYHADLKIFLDADDLHSVQDLESFVRDSKYFCLLITEGVLERPYVQMECRAALKAGKKIILVHDERNCKFPSVDALEADLKPILAPLAIPYYRPKVFREASIKMILDQVLH